jgi:hypothetical protein
MNRAWSVPAIFIALMALYLRVPLSPSHEGGQDASDAPSATAKGVPAKKTTPPGPGNAGTPKKKAAKYEPEIEGPWLATRRFYQSTDEPAPIVLDPVDNTPVDLGDTHDIQNCSGACATALAGLFGVKDAPKISWMTAIVPDPMHTRLPLFTDSSIGAILKAAGVMHWEFAGQWMPWYDSVNSDEKDPEKRRDQRNTVRTQERQPGLLIFRHFDEAKPAFDDRVLMVFLVGETPTTGVNPDQFLNARAYMRAIHDTYEVFIQGPTFSGSLHSLRKLIDQDRECDSGAYKVRSGTVTSRHRVQALISGAAGAVSSIQFFGAALDSVTYGIGFRDAVNALHIPLNQSATLVEDESAYGAAAADVAATVEKGIQRFRFPRDIDHLRNVYRDAVQDGARPGKAPIPQVDFSLKDEQSGEDSTPTFSLSQSPLSQDAVVNQIAAAILRERIRLVEITATNVLDLIFMTKLIKRQCPDTRVLLPIEDLLFVEEAKEQSLNGTLALSAYPLFYHPEENEQNVAHSLLPDSDSLGVFNSTVMTLAAIDPSLKEPSQLIDYGLDESTQPPVWLLTLDREGFLPLQVWPTGTNHNPAKDWFEPGSTYSTFRFQPQFPPRIWTVITGFTCLLILAFVVTATWVSVNKEATFCASLSWDNRPTGKVPDERDGWRVFYAAVILALLVTAAVLVSPPLSADPPWASVGILCAWVSGLCLTLAILLVLYHHKSMLPFKGILSAAAVLIVFVSLWHWGFFGSEHQKAFFAFRALELRLGSSPLWPVLAAIAALVLFCYSQKTRIYLAVRQAPEVLVPTSSIVSTHLGWADKQLKTCLDSLYRPCIDDHKGPLLFSLFVCLLAGAIADVPAQLSTLDGCWFSYSLLVIECLVVLTLLLTCWQVVTLWYVLRFFLTALEPLPFVNAFVRPERTGDRRPIWIRWLKLESLDVFYRTNIILHDLALNCPPGLNPERTKRSSVIYTACLQMLLSPTEGRQTALQAARMLRDHNLEIATEIFDVAINRHWRPKQLLRPAAPDPAEKSATSSTDDLPLYSIRGDPKEGINLMHALLALHYTPYLLYVVRQIQNLMWYLPAGFVLLTFSLTSYSLQSPQFIGRVLLLLFLLIGFVLWRCMSGMERDLILSRINGTSEGELNKEFYFKFFGYGALPALSLLASEFPSISNFLYSWVEPTVKALH